MNIPASASVICLALATAQAQVQDFAISIGVRETGFGGSAVGNIGGNGGTVGGIEWINRDGQLLPIDGQWHTFTFDFAVGPILGFAGTSANSILEGTYGVLEHVRVLNVDGVTAPITLLFDDFVDTTTTGGPVNFCDFELQPQGTEVMFRNALFSGSTAANVMAGATRGVENTFPAPSAVYRQNFQFIDGTPTRWVRFTSFNTANVPNPVVRFDDNSVVTFRMMAFTECGPNLGSQGPGTAVVSLCGSGLNANEAATFHAGFAPASSFGAIAVSFSGFPDLPVFGGNVVSGTGFLFTLPLFTAANGYAAVPLTGSPLLINFTMQGVFLDFSQPLGVGFSNAVQAQFGQ